MYISLQHKCADNKDMFKLREELETFSWQNVLYSIKIEECFWVKW